MEGMVKRICSEKYFVFNYHLTVVQTLYVLRGAPQHNTSPVRLLWSDLSADWQYYLSSVTAM